MVVECGLPSRLPGDFLQGWTLLPLCSQSRRRCESEDVVIECPDGCEGSFSLPLRSRFHESPRPSCTGLSSANTSRGGGSAAGQFATRLSSAVAGDESAAVQFATWLSGAVVGGGGGVD